VIYLILIFQKKEIRIFISRGECTVHLILSLDGDAGWSIIQVKALIALYGLDTSGHTVLKDFDHVAANSGGSVILGGLVENLKLSELLAYLAFSPNGTGLFRAAPCFSKRG
jgi:uncharacterized protein